MKPLIALCIGHSRITNGRIEGGAVTHDGSTNEWTWNSGLGELIEKNLHAAGVRSVVVSKYEGSGYTSAQRWVAAHLRSLGATAAIELHFNAADATSASGHEWLYWSTSKRGKALATALSAEFNLSVPEIKARGAKPRFHGDRGAEFLKLTHCPAVIAEPFFGSSESDWRTAQAKRSQIALAIANGILAWLD